MNLLVGGGTTYINHCPGNNDGSNNHTNSSNKKKMKSQKDA